MKTLKGSELSPREQSRAKAMFVHRFTKEHVPEWARKPRENWAPYKPHFASDAEWLDNTEFAVTKDGRISDSVNHCISSNLTWPEGK